MPQGSPVSLKRNLQGFATSVLTQVPLLTPSVQDFYTISEKFPVPPPDMRRNQIVRETIQPLLPPLKRKAAPSRQLSVPTKPTTVAPQIINGRSASESAVSRPALEGGDRLFDGKSDGAMQDPTRSSKRLHRTSTFPPSQIDRSLSCSDTSRFRPQAMRPGELYRSQSYEPSFTYPPPPPPYAANLVPEPLSAVMEYSQYYPGENYPRPPSHYYPRYHYPPPPPPAGMTPPPTFEHPSIVSPSSQFRPIEDGRPCDPNARNDEQIDVQPDDPFAPIPYFSPNMSFTDTSKATTDDQDEPHFGSGDSKSEANCVIEKAAGTQEVEKVNAGMSEKDRLAWRGDVAMFE